MQDHLIFRVLTTIERTNIVISFIINVFLLVAVVCSAKDLGGYRYLLFAFTLNDIYFPLIHDLTMPVICAYHNAFIMFSHGRLRSKFSICLFAAAHSQAMPILAHLFVYRLIALKCCCFCPTATNYLVILFHAFPLYFRLRFCNCWFHYNPDEELLAYVKPYLDEDFPIDEISLIGALYYDDQGIRISAIFAPIIFDSIMTIWVGVIIVCSAIIVRILKLTLLVQQLVSITIVHRGIGGMLSDKNEALQKRLFATLVLQMVVPMLCVYLPCAGIINLPFLVQVSAFPKLVSAALSFFPVADALITLFGVKSYRDYFRSFICFDSYTAVVKSLQKSEEANSSQPQPNAMLTII